MGEGRKARGQRTRTKTKPMVGPTVMVPDEHRDMTHLYPSQEAVHLTMESVSNSSLKPWPPPLNARLSVHMDIQQTSQSFSGRRLIQNSISLSGISATVTTKQNRKPQLLL